MRNYFKSAKKVKDYSRDSEKAIQELNLDWKVTKENLFTTKEKVKNHYATVRNDTFETLGIVGNRYTPIQNKNAFSFVDALIGTGNGEIINGGTFDGGSKVYLTVKLPKGIVIGDNDNIDTYLQIFNSHDGTSSLNIQLLGLRQICSNGLVGFTGLSNFKIRHSLHSALNLNLAKSKLGIIYNQMEELEKIGNKLAKIPIHNGIASEYFMKVFNYDSEKLTTRQKNVLYLLSDHYQNGEGSNLKTSKDTLWGAYQSVIEYLDHGQKGEKEKSNNFGSGYQTKVRALEVALEV